MNKTVNVLIVVVLIITVSAVVNHKKSKRIASETADANQPAEEPMVTATIEGPYPGEPVLTEIEITGPLPRFLDLGSTTCVPCKLMAPIIEELRTEYAGIMEVHFLDVNTNPILNEEFDIRVIPTQIFYDAEGQELFRHEGFMSKEDILAKWTELGIKLIKAE